ncbi:MAG TPA: hypothetical protein VF477_00045, partial [Mycobacterium sp.]
MSWIRRCLSALAAVLAVAAVVAGVITVDALGTPGNDSAEAKLAEWGRDHGLGAQITWLERLQYENHPPAEGGTPPGGIPTPGGVVTPAVASPAFTGSPLTPLAHGAPLPGEGVWRTVVTVRGLPAVQVAALRPDDVHTSFVAGVMRMNPALVRGELRPGSSDPGGRWQAANFVTNTEQRDVAVVFNGGFRLNDPDRGGYYSEGRTVAP